MERMRIGIMQGRLIPPEKGRFQAFPRSRWPEEFPLAAAADLRTIEWIFDEYAMDVNPLASDEGIARVRELASRERIEVLSVCADYFMDRPFLRVSAVEREERLLICFWLIERARFLGANRIIMPFVDASAIETDSELDTVANLLLRILSVAGRARVEIHLETSLPPRRFATLLDRIPHPYLKVNYDSGNSASLGYAIGEEFSAYGHRIGSVHIKDRVRGGGTVSLGSGDVDFTELFECLREVAYQGEFILQVARGVPGSELSWVRDNRHFVLKYLAGEIGPDPAMELYAALGSVAPVTEVIEASGDVCASKERKNV